MRCNPVRRVLRCGVPESTAGYVLLMHALATAQTDQLLIKIHDGVSHIDQQAVNRRRVTFDQLGELFLGYLDH